MRINKTTGLCALGVMSSALFLTTSQAAAQDWEWKVAPYLWGVTTSMDLYVNDNQVIGTELDFSDIVDKLDFAIQARIEGRKDKWGFFFDATWLDTGDSLTLSEAGNPALDGTDLKTDLGMALVETGGFYRPSGEAHGFDLLFGVRVISADIDIDVTVPEQPTETVSSSDTLTDGYIGARFIAPLSDHWAMSVRGDIGAGDTDLSWSATAMFAYEFGQNNNYGFLFGYRHLVLEFESTFSALGENFDSELDLTMSGPVVGFMFKF
jgi:hypothetical protein